MIFESWVWKEELKKELRKFIKLINSDKNAYIKDDYDDEEYDIFNLKVEKFFFTSFFIIRKLLEAKKLSNSVCKLTINCLAYPKIPRPPKLLDYYGHACDINKNYDLNSQLNVTLTLNNLCNLFVHSYIFSPCIEEESFNYIFINSTNTRNRYCYLINIIEIFKIIKKVAKDYVVESSTIYDKNTDTVIVNNYSMEDLKKIKRS